MKTTEPLKHIARPRVPWSDRALTFCGKHPNEFKSVVTAQQAKSDYSKMGRQRASLFYCMTCSNQATTATFETDPLRVVEIWWSRMNRWGRNKDDGRREVEAIAALIENHRAEFERLRDGGLSVAEEKKFEWLVQGFGEQEDEE